MTDPNDRPHDTFFKQTFSDERLAAAELRAVLPAEIVGLLDWDTLRAESGSFEAAKDRNRFCDLLFSVRRADTGADALVFVLFEHQSTGDRLMPLRMLRYMVRIWDAWLDKSPPRRGPLPPIVPVVLSHDERGWRAATRFHELFDADPEALLQHVPFWAHVFVGLESVPAGLRAIDRLIEYLGSAAGDRSVAVEQFAKTVVAHAPGAQVVMNSIETLREEGREQGREQGRRSTLIQLLRLKFGAVTEREVAQVEQADEAALNRYIERVLTAESASAVVDD